jgi:hypothetical protein
LSEHLDRSGSIFQGYVGRVYAQGGAAIGVVVASKLETDEFDVDAVAELFIDPWCRPDQVLDAVFDTINGDPGSRYHGKTTRRTRCVTVDFDGMHVDLTPAVLLNGQPERTSHIFHANEGESAAKHHHVVANPWGFANWFEEQMPAARLFADSLIRKMTEPLPDLKELSQKSLPLLALQLLKRWRNKRYDDRNVRKPPSVVLSFYVALLEGRRGNLLEEFAAQAKRLYQIFAAHDERGVLIDVRNPACRDDRFTDRWPGSLADQRRFTQDLHDLVADLVRLAAGPPVEDCNRILSDFFGERPTQIVFDSFARRYRDRAYGSGLKQYLGSGAVALGPSGIGGTKAAASVSSPYHTNFGSDGQEGST